MSSGGSSGGGSQQVVQSTALPKYAQQFGQQNLDIASSIASQPYPTYQGQLVAGFSPMQQQGIDQTGAAANSYQPGLNQAQDLTQSSMQPWNAQTAQQYMSPYTMAALQPQIQQLQLQQGMNQKGIDANATQAGAFGDARHGTADALNNFYGNLSMNDLVGQGMNSAYNTGLGAYQQQQQTGLAGANQMANIAGQQQSLGLNAANSIFGAGTQQQQLQQQQLNSAYQNFQNQTNWPIEMLNLRSAAVQNNPYTTTRLTSATPANSSAQNLGSFASLAGALGSL